MDQEKITINLTPVDLGKIDLLVSEGLYSTRADLIRTAVRRLLEENDAIVSETATRHAYVIGFGGYTRASLEKARAAGEKIRARWIGVLHIADDVSPELADEVFEQIHVRGVVRGPQPVLKRLAPKIERSGRARA
jgi:Arc/MetJ-type ribon-helix-helix transcriptional regulator